MAVGDGVGGGVAVAVGLGGTFVALVHAATSSISNARHNAQRRKERGTFDDASRLPSRPIPVLRMPLPSAGSLTLAPSLLVL